MEYITLANGVKMPLLGYGVYQVDPAECERCVTDAIAVGYRSIDTAQAYGNEAGVGEGIRRSGIPREEIFVTSKVAAEHKSYATAAQSIHQTLTTMGLDYVDLMLIHSPQPWAEVNQSDNRYFPENRQVWRALEDALSAGKVRAIGVSNFQPADLENLWATAAVKPMVNQVLCHISNTPLSLLSFCRSRGILLEAYSPVAHGEAKKNPAIQRMAQRYGVSVPQLCIRYDLQLGMVVLPKAANPEHMRENASLDFTISEEDMDQLLHLPPIQDYGPFRHFPVFGGKKNT